MKLTEKDIGKYFKRRDGSKAYCVGFDEHTNAVMSWGARYYAVGAEDGITYHGEENNSDIIAPWHETRTIKGWVNIYKASRVDDLDYHIIGQSCRNKDEAEIFANKNRVACKEIEITYTEGEGLE